MSTEKPETIGELYNRLPDDGDWHQAYGHRWRRPDRRTATLPAWDEMSDVDKGCALLHLWKRDWEGVSYAIREYPCQYLDDPRLVALSSHESCRHAVKIGGSGEAVAERLGDDEHQRLYDLALAEPDRRCLWGARYPLTMLAGADGGVAITSYSSEPERAARELVAHWAEDGHPGPMTTIEPVAETADLDAIRADLAECAQRWEDHDEDLYSLLAASGRLLGHGRSLLAEVERYRRARSGLGNRGLPLWRHSCGNVESFGEDWLPTGGGCDGCESGSPDPAEWQPLYLRASREG